MHKHSSLLSLLYIVLPTLSAGAACIELLVSGHIVVATLMTLVALLLWIVVALLLFHQAGILVAHMKPMQEDNGQPQATTPGGDERLSLAIQAAHDSVWNWNMLCNEGIQQRQAEERAVLLARIDELVIELEHSHKQLGKANRLREQFLQNVRHELRTPLHAVISFAETLQEQATGVFNEEQFIWLQSIEENGRHLLKLINTMIDLASIEAGQMVLNKGLISPGSICRDSLRRVEALARQKHVTLALKLDDERALMEADGPRLQQILEHLLYNAVQVTSPGGMVELHVVASPQSEVVQFTVSDTGIGIAREDMDLLFQPFVQLDGGRNRPFDGLGLGLKLALGLTELHGGSIHVESVVGHGSQFIVTLPAGRPDDLSPG